MRRRGMCDGGLFPRSRRLMAEGGNGSGTFNGWDYSKGNVTLKGIPKGELMWN
jgi:hypothetical protein